MARRFPNISRFIENFKNSLFVPKSNKTIKCVGVDQHGNKYMEKQADTARNIRGSRFIEEPKNIEIFYTPEVPVEWEAWLRGRRKDPPTPEEIEKNHQKMMQTKLRAQKIDAKYLEQTESEALPASSTESSIGETVVPESQTSEFPVYGEYESQPGLKYEIIDKKDAYKQYKKK